MASSVPELEQFGHDEAWHVGSALAARCRAEQLPVTISIWLGEQRVFHAALPGTSADNDAWVEKKAQVVRRFNRSSLEVYEHYVDEDAGLLPDLRPVPRRVRPRRGRRTDSRTRSPGRRAGHLRPRTGRRPRPRRLRLPRLTSTRHADRRRVDPPCQPGPSACPLALSPMSGVSPYLSPVVDDNPGHDKIFTYLRT